MRLHYLELIFFSTYAELRAERSRSYLGLIWWILEPAMNMAVFYLVFGVIMRIPQADYVPFLLVGLTLWQWFKSCVSHAGHAIWNQLGLIRQVKISPQVFPAVQILADTVKFIFILLLLMIILWCSGYKPSVAYIALIPVLIIEFIFATGAGYIFAAVLPLAPDLRFIIEQVLTVLMWLSGVVVAFDNMPEAMRFWLALNPVAQLVMAGRGILMYGKWPDWIALGRVGLVSLALLALGSFMIARLTPRYVKLPV
jgi:lipopolysaccharide transport system permease protein